MVFDPFCGCATTLVAADRLQREWIGIDISAKAAELVVERIRDDQGLFEDIIARDDVPNRTDLGEIPRYNAPENKTQLYGEQGGHCNGCGEHFQTHRRQFSGFSNMRNALQSRRGYMFIVPNVSISFAP